MHLSREPHRCCKLWEFSLSGVLITASGLLVATMYDIGIVVMVVGAMGVLIRFIDWLRWLRT